MRNLIIAILCVGPVLLGYALARTVEDASPMPESLKNARSVYLTSPSGDEFGMFPMPEDKEALIATRKVITDAHRLKFVFDPNQADMIVVVSGRASRDTIKVFDGRDRKTYLWHLSGKNGLQGEGAALARLFESEFEKATLEEGTRQTNSGH
jgi:hypothetical protein